VGKILRYGAAVIAGIVIIIQFVPFDLPPASARPDNDLLGSGEVPEAIASVLKVSCYDCHSVETRYPWYSHVAPMSWLVAKDVREGREEMNLSEWKSIAARKKVKSLENIKEEVLEGHMPLPVYLTIHWDARLTGEQRKQIADWANSYQDKIINEPDPEEDEEEDDEENE
jgi:hypothetical protein